MPPQCGSGQNGEGLPTEEAAARDAERVARRKEPGHLRASRQHSRTEGANWQWPGCLK